jgi:hypothetical protein
MVVGKVTEAARRNLYAAADAVLGIDNAETLMNSIPPNWEQFATKSDLATLRHELRGEMADLRGELRTEMGELRGELRTEMGELRGELRGEMGQLRHELCGEMHQLRGEIYKAMNVQTWRLIGGVGVMMTLITAFDNAAG